MRISTPTIRLGPRASRRLADILAIAALAMVAASALLLVPNMSLPSFIPLGFFGVAAFMLGLTYSAVGWLIVSRGRGSRIGWLLLLMGLSQAVDTFARQYATYGLLGHPGTLPLADVAAWVYFWAYSPGLLVFFPTLLLFPDGTLPSRRWRPVLWAVAIAAVLILPATLIATWPFRGVDLLAAETPAAIMESNALLFGLVTVGNLLLSGIALATLLGIVVRFRRSRGVERQQLKWFLFAAAVTVATLLVFSAGNLPTPFDAIAAIVEGAILPIAVAIAVLRYRLYEIDIVIRRTLVYVPLTALLAGIYAASLGVSQRLFIAIVGDRSDAAVIISTLILATTFTPIKNALQGRVDRALREADDAERRLLAFTQAVHDHWARPDPGLTMRAFLAAAVGALKAGGGEAWFETAEGEESVGATPARTEGPRLEIPVVAGRQRFGRLELDPRPGGGAYRPRDLAALQLAADHLALSLSGFRNSAPAARTIKARL